MAVKFPMATKTMILQEIVWHFNEHERSQTELYGMVACQYKDPNGNHCGFGYCCNWGDPRVEEFLIRRNNTPIAGLREATDDNLDMLLKPWYHGHSAEFWVDVQLFHDTGSHWRKIPSLRGWRLTEQGQKHLGFLMRKWGDNNHSVEEQETRHSPGCS